MAMVHCKHVMVNTDDMKLVLGISAKIRSNYFSLIDAPDCPAPATTTCHLHAASTPPTTAAAALSPLPSPTTVSLPPPSAIRVFTCQMVGIRAPVQFTKLILEKQEEEKEEKKKKGKEKNNDDNKDDNDDD
ncbi:hypothetical protein CISG_09864 [Coccidioides immitis RMSCC 3703]|uniref:Uncharacterized protein n=1 Tax=Coccidioides immitis RMSCC 3703 TaxID=454286 RepID=A0A0J8QLI3_COCIT|nr:hypothetical protein CISG_09864 [Coccidioides immitis RMSCC 3703]